MLIRESKLRSYIRRVISEMDEKIASRTKDPGLFLANLAKDKDKDEDEAAHVKSIIAYREDLLKIKGGEKILIDLSYDPHEDVKAAIASRKDLLKFPGGSQIIRRLAKDKSKSVSTAIRDNYGKYLDKLREY